MAVGYGISANVESAPLLSDGLGETSHSGFCGRIVSLTDVSVQACDRGDIDNRAVGKTVVTLRYRARVNTGECYKFAFAKPRGSETKPDLEAHVRCGSAHESEGSTDMDLHYDVESVVGHCVQHAIIGEAS